MTIFGLFGSNQESGSFTNQAETQDVETSSMHNGIHNYKVPITVSTVTMIIDCENGNVQICDSWRENGWGWWAIMLAQS